MHFCLRTLLFLPPKCLAESLRPSFREVCPHLWGVGLSDEATLMATMRDPGHSTAFQPTIFCPTLSFQARGRGARVLKIANSLQDGVVRLHIKRVFEVWDHI